MTTPRQATLTLNLLAGLDDLAAIVSKLSVSLAQTPGLELWACTARPDLWNPFALSDRWEQLNAGAQLPADYAPYEIDFVLDVAIDDAELSNVIRPLADEAVAEAVSPDRDEKPGNPRSVCWSSTLG